MGLGLGLGLERAAVVLGKQAQLSAQLCAGGLEGRESLSPLAREQLQPEVRRAKHERGQLARLGVLISGY